MTIPRKRNAGTPSEHFLVGGHPFHAEALGKSEHFFRNATLRRPNALGTNTEYLLVQI